MRSFLLIFAIFIFILASSSSLLFAQSTTTTTTTTSSPPSTTTTTTNDTNNNDTNSTTIPPSNNSNYNNNSAADSFFYGDDIDIETNTSQYLDANKCMNLNSNLKHPDLKMYGADVKAPLCVPIPNMAAVSSKSINNNKPLHGWYLQNGTRSLNRRPTDEQLDNCIATCSMALRPRSSTSTVIFMFGVCYCYDQDFHDPTTIDKTEGPGNCCHDSKMYEDYMMQSKCINNMYGNVYVTSFLCPLNGSLCSTTLAKEHCETTTTSAAHNSKIECCVPEGSLYVPSSFGMQIAQYTVVFICILALFQVLYWILRKRREENEENEEERNRDRPRLLIVPTVASTNASTAGAAENQPHTVTQAGATDQHAVAAAKEIASLYPVLTPADLQRLEQLEQEMDCAICIDPLRNSKALKTPCDHRFHHSCLFQYLAHKLRDKVRHIVCPTCRAILVDASVNEENPASSSSPSGSPNNNNGNSPNTRNATLSPSSNRSSNPLHFGLLANASEPQGTEMISLQVPTNGVSSTARQNNRRTSVSNGNQQLTPRGAAALL